MRARTTAPSTTAPASRRARRASDSDAPVVTTSSTRSTAALATGRVTRRAPARLARRAAAPSPAWSKVPRRCRSTGAHRAAHPCSRSAAEAARAIRSVASRPRRRTARPEEGTGTSSTGPDGLHRAATSPASARPSGTDSPARPLSLWARTSARKAPS
ncbi:hypothetical protein [Actinocorallia aurantiaca]|uniref:hypothetical protein n=1 Tax=Actinocorallia aurantiaca TaxID=46204 RepID=UPI0031CE55B7